MQSCRLVPASLVAALVAAAAAGGCQHGADERLGLDERSGAASFRIADLARPGELERALARPSTEAARRLGGYRLVTTAHLELARAARADGKSEAGDSLPDPLPGPLKESYQETWRLEQDAQGSTHLAHEDDRGGGIELVAVGRELYSRPRYARYSRRPVEGDELERARDQAWHVVGSYLGVLGRFAARRDAGSVAAAGGRSARRVALSLAPTPAALVDGEPAHALRQGMKVGALEGEVWLDEADGEPLHAVLRARYTTPRADGGLVLVSLDLKSDVEAVGGVAAIAAPEGALPPASRPRPLLDRQQLLDKLVTER
jgi:hypothetical protein